MGIWNSKYLDKDPIGWTFLKNINSTNVIAVQVFWILNWTSLNFSDRLLDPPLTLTGKNTAFSWPWQSKQYHQCPGKWHVEKFAFSGKSVLGSQVMVAVGHEETNWDCGFCCWVVTGCRPARRLRMPQFVSWTFHRILWFMHESEALISTSNFQKRRKRWWKFLVLRRQSKHVLLMIKQFHDG